MKTPRVSASVTRPARRRIASLASVTLATLVPGLNTLAADLYWGGSSGASWTAPENWFTDASGLTASGAAPTIGDNLFFNTTANTANGQASIGANIAASSFTFNSPGTMRLSQTSNSNRVLTLGPGGITLNSGAGAVQFGESSGSLSVQTTASQTWTNNSGASLTVRSPSVSNTASGNVTLTLNAAGSGAINTSLGITDSPDTLKKLGLVINSTGAGSVGFGSSANSYSGGTTIERGILQITSNSTTAATIGTAAVKLGHTGGSGNAALRLNTPGAVQNNLIVQAGNSGASSLEFIHSTGVGAWDGAITLNKDLSIKVANGTSTTYRVATVNGAISGGGGLVADQYNGGAFHTVVLAGANTYSGNTTVASGVLTLADSGSMTFYIGANGVTNAVGGAATASFAGSFNFDLSGADLTEGNSWTVVNVATLNESFTGTFDVQGFTDTDGDNIWTNLAGFSFNEATGILSYSSAIPEPSSYALLAGAGMLVLSAARRRR